MTGIVIDHVAYHRNGVCGAPFHAVLFRDPDAGRMLGVVFDAPAHVAVFDLDKAALGNVAFGVNSWRGDRYEPLLRVAVRRYADGIVTDPVETIAPEPKCAAENAGRANRFEVALLALDDLYDDDPAVRLTDLLADARHFCDASGMSFAELDRLAYRHYLAELTPTEGDQP